jgi:hypothetical protein
MVESWWFNVHFFDSEMFLQQKIVIKVQLMNTSKARSNAMKIAVGMLGNYKTYS